MVRHENYPSGVTSASAESTEPGDNWRCANCGQEHRRLDGECDHCPDPANHSCVGDPCQICERGVPMPAESQPTLDPVLFARRQSECFVDAVRLWSAWYTLVVLLGRDGAR